MKYSNMSSGMYIVRTKELPWLRVLSGVVCYVDSVDQGELHLHVTEDCVPKGNGYVVPVQADDGEWYDVSELMMDANSCIPPSTANAEFTSAVAMNYRNFLGLGDVVKPYSVDQAVGKICLLGESTPHGTIFGKTGFYVVSCDRNGYIAAYQGFSEYKDPGDQRALTLKILNLNGTKRAFYCAQAIVDECAAAYEADCNAADVYSQQIQEETIVSSTESSFAARRSRISGMELEEVVC